MKNYLVLYEAEYDTTTTRGAGPQAINFVAADKQLATDIAQCAADTMTAASAVGTTWVIKSITFVGHAEYE